MITIPLILGLPLNIWGGILLLALIIFQILNGLKFIRIPLAWHRATAFSILTLGVLHAVAGIGIWYGWLALG